MSRGPKASRAWKPGKRTMDQWTGGSIGVSRNES